MILTREEKVICVNEQDEFIELVDKMKAHRDGLLHRAFSVFVFNDKGELLLQQRAISKYHSGGLWSNTCCSHPRYQEETIAAAHRRMMEEMGFDCDLQHLFAICYKADVGNRMIEHEYDHVFVGQYSGEATPNEQEVVAYKYIGIEELNERVAQEPHLFTAWFKMILPQLLEKYEAAV